MVSLYQNMKLHFTIVVFKLLSSNCTSSLLTACSRLVIIKPDQVHPDIGTMTARYNRPAADVRVSGCLLVGYVTILKT